MSPSGSALPGDGIVFESAPGVTHNDGCVISIACIHEPPIAMDNAPDGPCTPRRGRHLRLDCFYHRWIEPLLEAEDRRRSRSTRPVVEHCRIVEIDTGATRCRHGLSVRDSDSQPLLPLENGVMRTGCVSMLLVGRVSGRTHNLERFSG